MDDAFESSALTGDTRPVAEAVAGELGIQQVEADLLPEAKLLFSTWGARMIALIGRLPSTLEDRAIVLPMRRRAPGETVERIQRDGLLRRLDPLRRRAVRWATDHLTTLRAADPAVPEELDDRQADNWRPLFAIADEAGGVWP